MVQYQGNLSFELLWLLPRPVGFGTVAPMVPVLAGLVPLSQLLASITERPRTAAVRGEDGVLKMAVAWG